MKQLITPFGTYEGKDLFELYANLPEHRFGWNYTNVSEMFPNGAMVADLTKRID